MAAEIVAVAEIDAALDDVGESSTAAFEQDLDVVQRLASFGGDVAGDRLLGGGIDWNLPETKMKSPARTAGE